MTQANSLPTPVRVNLGDRSYNINFYNNQVQTLADDVAPLCGERCLIISNPLIWQLHGESLAQSLASAGVHVSHWLMQDGEKYKSMESVGQALDFMIRERFPRKSTVVALGGGVAGDLAGFVAAIYMRGVDFIQIPTTVVAMVDSSVGGKTGVDHPLGKNMIGAFYQPKLVAVDRSYLQTLDHYNLAGGFAEVIKYGVIINLEFFEWLEQNIERALALEPDAIMHVIKASCEAKAYVVTQDEREGGLRAILNFGHTFAHAMESLGGYEQRQFHGQAVATGMCCACDLAVRLKMITPAEAQRVEHLIARAGLPTHLEPGMDPEAIYDRMFSDKKVEGGKLRFVLPERLGRAVVRGEVAAADVMATLEGRRSR